MVFPHQSGQRYGLSKLHEREYKVMKLDHLLQFHDHMLGEHVKHLSLFPELSGGTRGGSRFWCGRKPLRGDEWEVVKVLI